ncbi:hypothetical protein Wxf_00583 [Wolbachia endosymbiont of Armadillidium vulgare]|nr:hypothetical protein Wxf_00583 [Wolbachia endosymbiont of Armadillidium vulgare]
MSLLLLICGSYLILQYSPSLSLNLMAVVKFRRSTLQLINLARTYRTISEKPKDEIQNFLANQKENLSCEITLPKIDNFLP